MALPNNCPKFSPKIQQLVIKIHLMLGEFNSYQIGCISNNFKLPMGIETVSSANLRVHKKPTLEETTLEKHYHFQCRIVLVHVQAPSKKASLLHNRCSFMQASLLIDKRSSRIQKKRF